MIDFGDIFRYIISIMVMRFIYSRKTRATRFLQYLVALPLISGRSRRFIIRLILDARFAWRRRYCRVMMPHAAIMPTHYDDLWPPREP